jgi:hypothetical protein
MLLILEGMGLAHSRKNILLGDTIISNKFQVITYDEMCLLWN